MTYNTAAELPLVSVITVCYNSREALTMTIKNVVRQDYPNLEYIIIDGKSDDGSCEVIEQNKTSLSYFVSEPDNGIYDAMNKGVKACRGEYVIFMNAGDKFATNDVLKHIFSNRQNADVIYGDVVKDGVVKKAHPYNNSHRMCFCHQSSITSVECLREHPFDTAYKMSADFKLFKVLDKAGKTFAYVPLAIADFNTSGVSNTNRSAGLKENMRIVCENDGTWDKIRLLPRLLFVYFMCKVRGK